MSPNGRFIRALIKYVVEPEIRSLRCRLYNGNDRGDCQEHSGLVEGAELVQEALERQARIFDTVHALDPMSPESPLQKLHHLKSKLPPEILSRLKHIGEVPDDPDIPSDPYR